MPLIHHVHLFILTELINSDGYMSQLLRVLFIGFVLLQCLACRTFFL